MANTTNFIRKVCKHQEAVKFTVSDTSFPKFAVLFEAAGSFCLFLRKCLPNTQI